MHPNRSARVIRLPVDWQEPESTFIHRTQVRVGLRLRFWGRWHHGTIWKIVDIKSATPNGRYRRVDAIRHSSDKVTLLRVGSNETKELNFTYFSYSAVWRLAQ